MAKLERRGLRITLICDKMKSRGGTPFVAVFPQFVGKTIKLHRSVAQEIDPEVCGWLMANRYL